MFMNVQKRKSTKAIFFPALLTSSRSYISIVTRALQINKSTLFSESDT